MHQTNGVEVLHSVVHISRTMLPGQDQEGFVIQTVHSVIPPHAVLIHTLLSYYQFSYQAVQIVNPYNGVCFGHHSSRSIKTHK